VHLEDEGGGEWDFYGIDVNILEDVAVAGDLLLGAVSGLGAAGYDLCDAIMGGEDALDAVGGFGALDLGGVLEGFEDLGGLLGIELLAALVLAELANGLEEALGERLTLDEAVQEGAHEALI